MTTSPVDYDHVAPSYDRRYVERDYPGIRRTLLDVTEGAQRVLEVGCGTGYWLPMLARDGLAIGLEPSREMLDRTPRDHRVTVVRGRAESMGFAEQSVDAVVAVNALHHFFDKPAFAREALRVLRPGGRLLTIGLDPAEAGDSWFVYDYFAGALETDRSRYPGATVLRDWFLNAGFETIETTIAEHIIESRSAREYIESGGLTRESTSQLTLLRERVFDAGIAHIWRDIKAGEARETPLHLRADLRLYATSARAPDPTKKRVM